MSNALLFKLSIGFAADLVPMNLRLVDGGLLHNEAGGHTDKEIGSSDTDTTTAGTLVCLEAPDTSDHKPVVAAYRLCTRGGSGAIMVGSPCIYACMQAPMWWL